MIQRSPQPRKVAVELIEQVLEARRPLDESLDRHPALPALEGRDRAFVRNLAATTLRRLGQIDALIDHCLERPLPGKARRVRHILRLGVCQLLFLETPAHAAVDTTVRLAQSLGHGPHKRLVNAVLRRLDREGRALRDAQDAARLNTPDWLWRAWCDAYGTATARAIAEAHLGEAPLDITVKDPSARAAWADRLDAEMLPTGTLRKAGAGRVDALPGFDDGAWWVQDAAAALPVTILGPVAGQRIIDLCAAPGGKTAQLAAAGAAVLAVDRAKKRIERMAANLGRLGLTVDTVAADATTWRPDAPADAVLVDAPCSATGTLRRHPDVAALKTPKDVAQLAEMQARLLDAALDMVRPGGLIVYCSCSLQPEEGHAQVARRIALGGVEPVAVTPRDLGGLLEVIDDHGAVRSLPCHLGERGGMDGFYAARLRRV